MKFINFMENQAVKLGVVIAGKIIDVVKAAKELNIEAPSTMQELIMSGKKGTALMEQLAAAKSAEVDSAKLVYAPVVTAPEKLLCVGLNYMKHALEAKAPIPKTPVLFSKFANALAAHQQAIKLPAASTQCDYEAELVIVIGKEAVNVSEEAALDYVFGYTVGNDLSARDLQNTTSQWLLGKTPDGFAPVGPCILAAEGVDPNNLTMQCHVNGELRQNTNTNDMIFNCKQVISYVSKHMTLKPGDIIFTGTPAGVMLGYPEDKKAWLKPGDVVEVSIESIGTLTNTMA